MNDDQMMSTTSNYVLDGHEPRPEPDLEKWGEWWVGAERTVARHEEPGITVSTVFLAFDHNFGDGPPLLFETMVFGGDLDGQQWRTSTWDEAVQRHDAVVAAVTALAEADK